MKRFIRRWVFLAFIPVTLIGLNKLEGSERFEVDAMFSSDVATLGRTTKYRISIKKTDPSSSLRLESPSKVEVPQRSSFTIGRFQTSDQYSSSESDQAVGILLEYELVPKVVGRLIVPAFQLDYMGDTLWVPAVAVEVRSPDFDMESEELRWMYIELGLDQKNLRLGERVKTEINLYVFDGLKNVNYTKPQAIGSDFSLDNIVPGPTERWVTEGLFRYRRYSWPLTITPIRKGKISISFKVTVDFRIPNDRLGFIRASRNEGANSALAIERLLEDSSEESLTLFTDNISIEVNPLTDGEQPIDFYNAIGNFKISADLETRRLEVGNPTNLTLTISGAGNHGSYRAPELDFGSRWRVFNPQEEFENKDYLSFLGETVYRYVVIPLSAEIEKFPEISYSYFSLDDDEFIQEVIEPIPLEILGDSITADNDLETEILAPARVVTEETDLKDLLAWTIGAKQRLNAPFFERAWFYLVNVLGLAVFGMLLFFRLRVLRIRKVPELALRLKSKAWLKKYLKLAEKASKTEDSEQFYESVFLAFCSLISNYDSNVEAISVFEVKKRVRVLELNENIKRVISSYLDQYEAHRFSGKRPDDPPLKNEYSRLNSIVRQIEGALRKEAA
ncbi:MAG: hypothetical protein MI748_05420 [Opitutales bacterium]|nr:hypothetical protein [Opitutales bacterium]